MPRKDPERVAKSKEATTTRVGDVLINKALYLAPSLRAPP